MEEFRIDMRKPEEADPAEGLCRTYRQARTPEA